MGRVSFRAVGAAMIAVSALGCDAGSVDVIVDDMPSQIVISIDGSAPAGDTLELAVGQTARLSGEALNEIGDVVGDAEVVWASSNPSVASIDGSGVVTALAPGETDLSASAGGVDRVLPTLVREAAPHFLEVSPASVNLYGVGSSIQVAVIGRDELGNVISSGGVTWESLNPSVATVSSTGLVTAQGIGTTLLVIAAACCDSVEVPVSVNQAENPPPSGIIRGNEPSGMRTILDYGFTGPIPSGQNDVLFNDGSGLGIVGNSAGTVRQVNDQDGPQSRPGAMEREYTPGMDGTGVGDVYLDFDDADVVYMAAWVKHNVGFEWHPVSQKMAFFWDTRGNYILLQSFYGGQFLSLYRAVAGDEPIPYQPNQEVTPSLEGGEWEYIELLVDRNSGASGEAWVWQNGVLVNNHEIDMPLPFAQLKWDSTWGGRGMLKTRTDRQWTDHLYLSVR